MIKKIIEDYVVNVNEMCNNLISGINLQENLDIRTKQQFLEYRIKTRKMEFDANGVFYRLHGKGCFAFSDNIFLNWDFGYRSRWCGIDPFKIGMTLMGNKSIFTELYDGEILKTACEQAVKDNEMTWRNNLYYFTVPDNEMFRPDFPKEYDTLIIENCYNKWMLPRTKQIDKFIRKSNRVHSEVFNHLNVYILRFYLKEKEVYSIPYDDVCYPENAIEIMTDNIIRNIEDK